MAETYKTNTLAQLWMKTGIQGGKTTLGAVVTLSGKALVIKDRLCHEISSTNYAGKWIEKRFLDVVSAEPGPTPGPEQIVFPAHTVILEDEQGGILGLYKSERTIYTKVTE